MKALSPDDRPREKLSRHGAAVLGENELLALILGSGSAQANALAVANDILRRQGGVAGLARAVWADLVAIPGLGPAKAAQIVASVELGRRSLTDTLAARQPLRRASDAASFLVPLFGARPVEQFGVVLLDTRHRAIRTTVIATGTLNSTIVQPRDVFREAMVSAAAAVLVFHNHPSGDPTPSADDVALTGRLVEAGQILGIDVVDHLVLADARYCSLRELGRLQGSTA